MPDGKEGASPHQAQGIVNVAPGEGAPKQVTYEEMQNQLKTIGDQLMKAEGAEVDALGKKVAELESEIGRRATKTALTRKLTELSKKLSESAEDAGADAKRGESADSARKGESAAAKKKGETDGDALDDQDDGDGTDKKKPTQAESAGARGKGIISTEDTEQAGPNAGWFKDLLKANARMKQMPGASFSGEERRAGEFS